MNRSNPLLGFLLALLLALAIAACGGDDEPEETAPTVGGEAGEIAAKADEQGKCQKVSEPEPSEVDLEQPDLKPEPGVATFATSCGTFTVRFDTERAPKTSASVQFLIEEGVYDETTFHRVVPSFVVQGGDPTGEGTGGPGYFVDEPPPDDLSYTRGMVAMAKTEAEPPGRSGSQFFVVTAPADAGLPPDYALLGQVEDGYEAVERIEALGEVGGDGAPSQPVVIEKATFTPDDE